MTRVTAVSQDLARVIGELTVARPVAVDVVSMGVDTGRFQACADTRSLRDQLGVDGPLILFVGRLAEKKGVRYLLEAMPAVLQQHPKATLVIVGDGPLRGELSSQVSRLGLSHSVRFVGSRRPEDLPAFYSAAEVFVGPSIVARGGDTESFGLVFAEAMACGCPVVASDVGGISDLVRHEKTGLLVPQQDPPALAAAINHLLGDPDLARRLRHSALTHLRGSFTSEAVARRYTGILQEAAA
jgi:glycosyltransferase involved in cell wall biosynthesis